MLVAGRHRWKVQRTLRDLRGHTGNRRVFGYCYDLRSFEQTRAFAQHIKQDLQQHFNGRQVAAARLPACSPGLSIWVVSLVPPDLLACRLTALVNNAGVFNEEQVFTEVRQTCIQQLRGACQPACLSPTETHTPCRSAAAGRAGGDVAGQCGRPLPADS